MAENTFERIYQLKSVGIDAVLSDISKAIAGYERLGKAKNSLNGDIAAFSPQGLADFNKQVDVLITNIDKSTKAIEKNAEAATKLNESYTSIAVTQQQTSANMQESAAPMGKNIEVSVAGITKVQGAYEVTRGAARDYDSEVVTLGGKLAVLREQLTATGEQLKLLDVEFRNNLISESEYEKESTLLTVQLQQEKTQINEVTAAMTALNKVNNPALTEEQAAAKALDNEQLLQRNQLLKIAAKEELAMAGSINEARAQSQLFRKEFNDLNQTTDEGKVKAAALKKEIEELDVWIETHADKYTQRKINIGNYPTVTAEAAALRQEMLKLAAAGKTDSEEYAKLTARAEQLAVAQREVASTTKVATFSLENLGNRLEKTGFRMLVHMAIFQVAIELYQMLSDAITEAGRAQKEYDDAIQKTNDSVLANTITEQDNVKLLLSIAKDNTIAMNLRVEAVKKLQDEYPNYLGNLSKEAILTGEVTKEVDALNEALFNKALMEASAGKVKIAANKYQEIHDQIEKTKDDIAEFEVELSAAKDKEEAGIIEYMIIGKKEDLGVLEKQLSEAKRQIDKFNSEMLKYGKDAAGVILSPEKTKTKKEKEPHDYLNAELEAHKKYYESLAKLEADSINSDQIVLQAVYESDENNLDMRLNAYRIFIENKKELAELGKEAEILSDREKLDKIEEIQKAISDKNAGSKDYNHSFFTKDGKLGNEENTLILNKDAIQADLNQAKAAIALANEQISQEAVKGITGIVKNSFAKTIQDIDVELTGVKLKIEDEFGAKENKILDGKGSPAGKEKKLNKLENKKAIADDQQEEIADLKKKYAIEDQLREASDLQEVSLEQKLKEDLLKVEADYQAKKKDANKRQIADGADNKELQKKIENAAIGVIEQGVQAYMAAAEKKDEVDEARAKRSLDWNKKIQDGETQSLAQKQANDKAYMIAEQQLDRQKAQNEKKRAEESLAVNYAVSLMKIMANASDWEEGLIEAAAATATFAFAESQLARAPAYAQGTGSGTHPGGWAVVGDGYQPELAQINGKYFITPSVPTAVNMPAGSTVTPISNLGGHLGANLKAPTFNYSGNSGSASPGGNSDIHQSISMLHQTVQSLAMGMSNISVNLDTNKAGNAIKNNYYKQVKF